MRRMTYQPHQAVTARRARFEVHVAAALGALAGMLAIAAGGVLGVLIAGWMP